LLLLAASCTRLQVSTDFEAGSGEVLSVDGREVVLRVEGQSDQDGRNRQASWYCVRIDGAGGAPLRLRLTDLKGEYDYRSGTICITPATPPLVSFDGRTWTHHRLEGDPAAGTAWLDLTPPGDRVWISHLEPYGPSRLEDLRSELLAGGRITEEVIGRSVQGRPIRLWTVGDPAAPKVAWLMARQHAWESGTSFVAEGALRFLVSPEAAALRSRVLFKILPMMDPDGCAEGGVRFNRHGYDVNRNWDVSDPADPESVRRMPEIAAAKQALLDWTRSGRPVHLFLTLHNQEEGEWLSGSAAHGKTAKRFFDRLVAGSEFSPGRQAGPRAPAAPPAKGRFTVYQWLDLELGWPAFLLEQGVARSERLGRLPTSDDRRRFGRDLVRAMIQTVEE
jgi:hypothetical protein